MAQIIKKLNNYDKNIIVITGHMGSGKSLICKKLAKYLNWQHFDSDKEIEKSEEKKSDRTHVANKKPPLQTVGEFLREARQGRNLSIEDLSSLLRIGKEQLIALESGDESALPEKVFIRAMVRRIAEKLNLDTSFILEELNEKKNNV